MSSPTPSGDKRNGDDRLYLEHADNWRHDQYEMPDAQRLSGHVRFRHNGMTLTCDSAVYYEKSSSFRAFGNVHMVQGDTLSLTGRRLYYDGESMMAEVREDVVMKHRGQTLTTDSLNYDRLYSYAYFFNGGELVDGNSRLTADWGEYHTDTRLSTFNYNVRLSNPKFTVLTDTLHYDMATKWANMVGATNIYSGNDRIYTERGFYNTQTEESRLYDRSEIFNKGTRMKGDSIFYDKATGEMQGFRNVVYRDTVNRYEFFGDYCRYNELKGDGLAYGHALAKDYSNGPDTLYMHADTLRLYSFNLGTDSVSRVMHGYFHARAYRTDVQAVADSLVFESVERKLSLFKDPIVWSENKQIVGEEINAWANDSTLDSVYVRRQALLVEQLDSVHYNQVSGNLMRSYFKEGVMRLNCVDGNAVVINYPLEKDSAIIYQNATETAKLRMTMKEDGKLQRLWAPGSKGTLYVAGLAPRERTVLPNFAWFDYIRPVDKNDIYEWRAKKKGSELKPSVRHTAPVQVLQKALGKKAKANEEKAKAEETKAKAGEEKAKAVEEKKPENEEKTETVNGGESVPTEETTTKED